MADDVSASKAPKSTLVGCKLVERAVDRTQHRPPARGVADGVVEVRLLAQRVVQLRGVEAKLRMRQRETVGKEARAGDAERHLLLGRGLRDRGIEQRQQRRDRRQRLVTALDEHVREGGDDGGIRRVTRRARHALRLDGSQCGEQPFAQRLRHGDMVDLRGDAFQLEDLHLQSQTDRVPPVYVGAAVGIVADPARQDDRPRRQRDPLLRPSVSRLLKERPRERIDRVTACADRRRCLFEFVGQRRPGRTMAAVSSPDGLAARERREVARDRCRQRERRMSGEHGRKSYVFDIGAERGEVGLRDLATDILETVPRCLDVRSADIGGQAPRAIVKGIIAQLPDQPLDRAFVQRAVVEHAGHGKRHVEDRIAERVFVHPLAR